MKTENNGLVPSILHLWSMFPHLSLAPCSAAWAHQACVLVCLFVFIHHCWGRVEGFWSGWGKLYKSRVGGGWRDFSCPGQKESGPGPPLSLTPAPPSLPSLPSSPLWWMMICVTLRLPASTGGQLAACWLAFGWTGGLSWGVICGTWGTLTSPLTYAGVRGDDLKLPGWKGDTSNEGPGSMLDQTGSHTAESSLKITNGS